MEVWRLQSNNKVPPVTTITGNGQTINVAHDIIIVDISVGNNSTITGTLIENGTKNGQQITLINISENNGLTLQVAILYLIDKQKHLNGMNLNCNN